MTKPRTELWQKQMHAYKVERLETLRNLVVDGKDAEAVLKYVERFRREVEKEVLEALVKPGIDLREAQTYYRVTNRFCEMLTFAAQTGKRKEEDYNSLKKELHKEE